MRGAVRAALDRGRPAGAGRANVETPAVVASGTSFKVGVECRSQQGALDVATPPGLRVALEPECGGSFAGSAGPVAIDQQIPAAGGGAYRYAGSGSAKLTAFGPQTVCAFLEDGEERQFATSTDTVLDVSKPCTVATERLFRLRRAVRRAARRAAHSRSRAAQHRARKLLRPPGAPPAPGKAASGRRLWRGPERGTPSATPPVPQIKHLFTIV